MGKGHILPAPVLPRRPLPHGAAADADVDRADASAGEARWFTTRRGTQIAEHSFGNLARGECVGARCERARERTPRRRLRPCGTGLRFRRGRQSPMAGCTRCSATRDRKSGHVGGDQFRLAHLQHRAHLQGRAAILFGAAARPFDAAVPAPSRPRRCDTLCHLIYPVSKRMASQLADRADPDVEPMARRSRANEIQIPASGSLLWKASEMFDAATLARAGAPRLRRRARRDLPPVRLSGRVTPAGAFSFDHMFGF